MSWRQFVVSNYLTVEELNTWEQEWRRQQKHLEELGYGEGSETSKALRVIAALHAARSALEAQQTELGRLQVATRNLLDEFPHGKRGFLTTRQQYLLRDLADAARGNQKS